ncbi:MAG: 2-dehydropantoate 2-reductase [Treponemataceae bacterium]
MKNIGSVAIIGGGALGLMYAQAVKAVLGNSLYFVADGDRYERFRETAFLINGKEERFAVRKPDAIESKPDLVLVAVKNYDLPGILPTLERICGSETTLVSVLNGIDSESILERALPASTVLYCCGLAMDAVKDGRSLTFTSRGKLLLGTKDNRPHSALDAVAEFCTRCGLAYNIPADIHRELWWKWMINIGVNQVSAVTGAAYGVFHKDPDIRALMEAAMREVVLLAQAEGINLRDDDIAKMYPILNGLGAEGKTSMLQDMENRRKTELESFSGKLIRMARARSLPVPVNETLYRVIAVRERLFGR